VTKTPPASVLLKQAAKIAKGSGNPKKDKVGAVNAKQIREIAELKYQDLNAVDMAGAIRIIEGTAKSMGIEITA
jgi:large subunit ribosomal protein L11